MYILNQMSMSSITNNENNKYLLIDGFNQVGGFMNKDNNSNM